MDDRAAGAFNRELRRLPTPAACADLFGRTIAPFGFDTFASGEVDLDRRHRSTFHLIAWPDRWRRFYLGSGLLDRDPIVAEVGHRREPFTWSDLRAERKLSLLGTHALDLAAAAGWVEGLIVPLPQASGRIGLVSLAGNRDCSDPATRSFLTLISVCLHGYVRTLMGRHGFAMPPAGLTDREIAAVRLSAAGKSDAAIGRDLDVAASTAHEFIEKAKRKLDVRSRAELAAIAAALGIVDI